MPSIYNILEMVISHTSIHMLATVKEIYQILQVYPLLSKLGIWPTLGLQHSGCHSCENGNPETENRYSWIPRIKCGAGSAGVYPDENRGRNDKPKEHQTES